MMYGSLQPKAKGRAPAGHRWTSNISIPVAWIRAFLEDTHGSLVRRITLPDHLGHGLRVRITTDASPWGLGGVLEVNNQIEAYFASPVFPFTSALVVTARCPL